MTPLQREIIAGHEAAIDTYTKVVADLMSQTRNPLINDLINQYLETLKILREELKEIKTR
jgi:hypothetical protein